MRLGQLFGNRRRVDDQGPPLARTSIEARLYVDLHPCGCGETAAPQDSALTKTGSSTAGRISGACPRCGTYREFVFRMPEPITPPSVDVVTFGDGTPSELLDPGEWLWVADQYASTSPEDTSGLDPKARRAARQRVAVAVAAVDEALAFVPGTAKKVPSHAFRTDRSRSVYAAEPGRFTRDRLQGIRDTYQEILDKLDVEAAG